MRKKHFGITAVFILLLLLLATWLFFPLPQIGQNDLEGVSIATGQEEFARQYVLGVLYEQEGNWTAAQDAYAEAALAEQAEIQNAAGAGLVRVLTAESSWRFVWRGQWASTVIWFGQMLFVVTLAGLMLWLIWLLRRKRKPQPGYLIQPVQDFTKDRLGDGLHHLLALRIQTVRRAQDNAVNTLQAQSLAAGLFPILTPWEDMSEPITNALTALDKVSVVGVNVSLRPLAQTIHTLWRKQEHTLTAQLHQRDSSLYLHAEMHHYLHRQPVLIWDIEGDPDKPLIDQKETITREWAYRLLTSQVSDSLDAGSWRSLGAYLDGLLFWQRYKEDGRYLPTLLQQTAQQFQTALVADPTFVPAQFALGTIYNSMGLYEKAEIAFRDLEAVTEQNNLPLHYNLGVSFYHQVEKGIWARREAVEQFRIIQNKLEETRGNNDRDCSLLALAYAGLGMVCALEVFEKIKHTDWVIDAEQERLTAVEAYTTKSRTIARQVENEKTRIIVLAAADHTDGFALLQAGQPETARGFLELAVKGRPDYPVPYINLADTYAKESDEAVTWLKRALTIQPGFAFGWFRLGQAYDKKAKSDPICQEAAHDAFHKAIGFADAQDRLGTMAFKERNYEQAMMHYHTAVRLNSSKEHIWRNMAWRTLQAVEQGWISAEADTLHNVLQWADQALKLAQGTRKEWRAHDVRGWVLQLLILPKDALVALDKSLALAKKAQNLYHRAQVYAQIKKFTLAQADLDDAKSCSDYAKWAMVIHTLQNEIASETKVEQQSIENKEIHTA